MCKVRYSDIRRAKYRVDQDVTYELPVDHLPLAACFRGVSKAQGFIELQDLDGAVHLTVRRGYLWDGCSGPTWDDQTNMDAGLVHDALYQLMREGVLSPAYRDCADRLMYRLMVEAGSPGWRASYYYLAVRLFAARHARPRKGTGAAE